MIVIPAGYVRTTNCLNVLMLTTLSIQPKQKFANQRLELVLITPPPLAENEMKKEPEFYICKTCSKKIHKDSYRIGITMFLPDGQKGDFWVCEDCYNKELHFTIPDMCKKTDRN